MIGRLKTAAGADGRERVAQIVEARVLAEPGALPDEVPDMPERGQMLARLVAGKHPCGERPRLLAQSVDQLDRRRAQRQLVRLALLGVGGRLDPVAGLARRTPTTSPSWPPKVGSR